jgi:hypothetical protein
MQQDFLGLEKIRKIDRENVYILLPIHKNDDDDLLFVVFRISLVHRSLSKIFKNEIKNQKC